MTWIRTPDACRQSRRGLGAGLWAGLLAALLGACTQGHEIELWRRPAERWAPRPLLELHSEAAASQLGEGWWRRAEHGPHGPFRWAVGRRAELRLALPSNARALALEAAPAPGGPGSIQRLQFRLGGRLIGERGLTAGWSRIELPLSPPFAPGAQELVLEADWTATPGSADPRPLAFQARVLEVLAPGAPALGSPDPELALPARPDPVLRLAGGSTWDLPLQAPGNAWLQLEARRTAGAAAELRLRWEDAAGLKELGRLRPHFLFSRRVRVPFSASGPGRLLFECMGGWDAVIELHRPTLYVALPLPSRPASGAQAAGPRPRNLVIYLLDALRADALGGYGGPFRSTPHLDRLSRLGRLFERLLGQSAWTRPAIATLFTGLAPWTHRTQTRAHVLSAEATTLAERFAEAGWFTGAVVSNGNASAVFGITQGFEWSLETFRLPGVSFRQPGSLKLRSDRLNELALQGLDAAGQRPFFLFLHSVDPHHPYAPTEPLERLDAPGPGSPAEGDVDRLRRMYRASVLSNDRQIGGLLDLLRRRGLLDSTLLLFLSDHGEEFLEHGRLRHGHGLPAEILHLPLLLSGPGVVPGLESRPLAMCDLAPSLLAAFGLPADLPAGPGDGRVVDLLGDGRLASAPRPVHVAQELLERPPLDSIQDGRHKLIRHGRRLSLHDLMQDPAELHDLSADLPFVRRALLAELLVAASPSWTLPEQSLDERKLDRQVEEQLRALGYLD